MGIELKTNPAAGKQGGFTLFELLVVIGIAGILAAIGLPAMRQFAQNYHASNAASGLVTSLNYARSEAIKEDQPSAGGGGVQVCASTGAACNSADWATGWIVLSPANPAPLQVTGALPNTFTVRQTPANAAIVFQPNGTAPALAVGANGRFMLTLCDNRGANYAREVEISVSGIIQASSAPGKDVSGAALTCP